MKRFNHYIFDLDGTLTNPLQGICSSFEFAFQRLGLPIPTQSTISKLIGPPLAKIVESLIPGADPAIIELGVQYYREHYSKIGLLENEVYPGICELLERLKLDAQLSVATSKPQPFAERVIKEFHLEKYFSFLFGSSLTSRESEKDALISKAIQAVGLPESQCVMIGDREFDISGAKKNKIASIGILWGFGSFQELKDAGADWIVENPRQIAELTEK